MGQTRQTASQFHPPAPEQVERYLDRNTATGPSRWVMWLPTMVLGAIVFLALTWTSSEITLLVWLLLGGLLFWGAVRARYQRSIEDSLLKVQEYSLEQGHVEALRLVWPLIPRLRTQPQMHIRAVALLAHNLERVQAHEAAVVAFDRAIAKLPSEHPIGIQLRVEQAMAQLSSQRLTDADDSLRKLRSLIEPLKGSLIESSYHLSLLYQQACTYHFDEMLQSREGLVERLRPLGVDAAYGYALMALGCYQMRHLQEAPSLLEQAAAWWGRATLLLPSQVLVKRFEVLKPLQAEAGLPASSSRPVRQGSGTEQPAPAFAQPHAYWGASR